MYFLWFPKRFCLSSLVQVIVWRRTLLWLFFVWTKWPLFRSRYFADDSFKYISMNEDICISTRISLKIVLKGSIDKKSSLIQVMIITWTNVEPSTHICDTKGDELTDIDRINWQWIKCANFHRSSEPRMLCNRDRLVIHKRASQLKAMSYILLTVLWPPGYDSVAV